MYLQQPQQVHQWGLKGGSDLKHSTVNFGTNVNDIVEAAREGFFIDSRLVRDYVFWLISLDILNAIASCNRGLCTAKCIYHAFIVISVFSTDNARGVPGTESADIRFDRSILSIDENRRTGLTCGGHVLAMF